MTEGEYRVGVSFNPSNKPEVDSIKQRTAVIIDSLAELAASRNLPGAREAAIAMTYYEDAAMWGVKALTKSARQ